MRAGVRRPWVGRVLHQGSVELRAGGIVLSVLRERHVMMGREPPIVAVARGEAIQQVQQCALLPGATVLCKWSDALPWAEAQLTYAAPRRKPTHSASAEMQHPRTPGPGIAGARKSLVAMTCTLAKPDPTCNAVMNWRCILIMALTRPLAAIASLNAPPPAMKGWAKWCHDRQGRRERHRPADRRHTG
jgi:hypothetical protein